MKTTPLLILALALLPIAASAQTLGYDNEQQLMGAAAFSPSSTYQILQKLVNKCGGVNQSLKQPGARELQRWEQRHHAYLEQNARVRLELEKMYTQPDARKAFLEVAEKTVPAVIQKQYEAMAAPIDAVSGVQQKEQICQSYFKAISARQFDLKNNDTAVAAYLDKRIAASTSR